jgi:hypothetical protein
MKSENEYNRLEAVRVVVEERAVDLSAPATWKTKVFEKLEELPEHLPPAFADAPDAKPLPIGSLVRSCYEQGVTETVVEDPYRVGSRSRQTILRTVRVKLRYKKKA